MKYLTILISLVILSCSAPKHNCNLKETELTGRWVEVKEGRNKGVQGLVISKVHVFAITDTNGIKFGELTGRRNHFASVYITADGQGAFGVDLDNIELIPDKDVDTSNWGILKFWGLR